MGLNFKRHFLSKVFISTFILSISRNALSAVGAYAQRCRQNRTYPLRNFACQTRSLEVRVVIKANCSFYMEPEAILSTRPYIFAPSFDTISSTFPDYSEWPRW